MPVSIKPMHPHLTWLFCFISLFFTVNHVLSGWWWSKYFYFTKLKSLPKAQTQCACLLQVTKISSFVSAKTLSSTADSFSFPIKHLENPLPISPMNTYHSCCGSSMTNRILNFLERDGEGADCSTKPAADAAVCLTTLVMELKELKKPEEPLVEDWACWGCWASWLGRRSWAAGELAGTWVGPGALVGDGAGAGAAPCWEGEEAGGGAGGSGLWRSVM